MRLRQVSHSSSDTTVSRVRIGGRPRSALLGTRTCNVLIRRQCHASQRPGHLAAGLPGWLSAACVVFRRFSALYGQNQAIPAGAGHSATHAERARPDVQRFASVWNRSQTPSAMPPRPLGLRADLRLDQQTPAHRPRLWAPARSHEAMMLWAMIALMTRLAHPIIRHSLTVL